jgi:hypothetical protein
MKAQAVLFYSIMFMLLSAVSVAIIFSFLSTYGQQETAVLQSANTLNYVQSIMKVAYFIDASTLYNVNIDYGNGIPLNCTYLQNFQGVTVAQLLKKDLSDYSIKGISGAFDNMFGNSPAPGKKALRCLMYEVMQPFVDAGYDYHVDIYNLSMLSLTTPYPFFTPNDSAVGSYPFTNYSVGFAPDLPQYSCGQDPNFNCYNVTKTLNSTSIMTVGTPFFVTDPSGNSSEFVVNLCVWKQQYPISSNCNITNSS